LGDLRTLGGEARGVRQLDLLNRTLLTLTGIKKPEGSQAELGLEVEGTTRVHLARLAIELRLVINDLIKKEDGLIVNEDAPVLDLEPDDIAPLIPQTGILAQDQRMLSIHPNFSFDD
jgi:hypothetical protein